MTVRFVRKTAKIIKATLLSNTGNTVMDNITFYEFLLLRYYSLDVDVEIVVFCTFMHEEITGRCSTK